MLVVFDRYGSYICFGSNNTNQLLVLQQKMQHFQGTNTLANVTSKNCQVQKPEALKVQEWALEPFAGGKIPRQIFRRHHFLYLPKLCSCQCCTIIPLFPSPSKLRSPSCTAHRSPWAATGDGSRALSFGRRWFQWPCIAMRQAQMEETSLVHFDNVAGIWVDLAWCSHVCTCSLVT